MIGLYLAAIVGSMIGMGLIDFRFKVALFGGAAKRTLAIVAGGVVFFLAWDVVGIACGVFFRGHSTKYVGIELIPELPLEEVFFLAFLCYLTIVIWRIAWRAVGSREAES